MAGGSACGIGVLLENSRIAKQHSSGKIKLVVKSNFRNEFNAYKK